MPEMLSVGIDIGTSTTQVVFSRITIDNTAGYFSAPVISIVDKKIIYKSEIHFTPLRTEFLINGEKVREIVSREYQKAGYCPEDVDTGAVIITGESARKENAALVLEKLSNFAGDFVVSTAGADLESIIAGKGSGAYQYSMEHECSVINLDIGGGTTNIVQFQSGEIVGKSCFDIGGRLLTVKQDQTVLSVSPTVRYLAEKLGLRIEVGEKAEEESLKCVAGCMSEVLAQAVGLLPENEMIKKLHTENSSWLNRGYPVEKICFSGGVADCIYRPLEKEKLRFGDIGVFLGDAIRNSVLCQKSYQINAGETIRATVVGAGMHTTNLSGSTIFYDDGIFPVKNIPVLKIGEADERKDLTEKVRWFLEQNDSEQLILAIRGMRDPGYQELKALAQWIWEGMDRVLGESVPIIVVVEHDIAKALGMVMKKAADRERRIAVIDSVCVDENDFVDIGHPMMNGLVVPVIIKTLLLG